MNKMNAKLAEYSDLISLAWLIVVTLALGSLTLGQIIQNDRIEQLEAHH